MQSDFFIKRRTSYEEIQNKKLKEFYVVVQMVSTELYLGEGTILEPSKVIMLYGLDILGFRTILGMYIENKEDNRYWISELEKIKRRGLKKILYVSIEENNKRLEQALRIVYNPYINESINERVEKVAKYTQKKWASYGEQEIIRAYLAENKSEYEAQMQQIEEKYKENYIGSLLIKDLRKKMDKDIESPLLIRHMINSYASKRKLKNWIKKAEHEYEEIKDMEDLVEKKKDKFTTFERMTPYSKEKWAEILNEIYKVHYEEVKEFI